MKPFQRIAAVPLKRRSLLRSFGAQKSWEVQFLEKCLRLPVYLVNSKSETEKDCLKKKLEEKLEADR